MDTQENNTISNNNDIQTKFCQHCGAKIDTRAVICPKCGVPVDDSSINHNSSFSEKNKTYRKTFWWNLLAFFIPIVGFICWFVWKNSKPLRAHNMVVSAWWGFALNMILIFLN